MRHYFFQIAIGVGIDFWCDSLMNQANCLNTIILLFKMSFLDRKKFTVWMKLWSCPNIFSKISVNGLRMEEEKMQKMFKVSQSFSNRRKMWRCLNVMNMNHILCRVIYYYKYLPANCSIPNVPRICDITDPQIWRLKMFVASITLYLVYCSLNT